MIGKLIDFEYKNYPILSLSKSPAKEIVIYIQPFPYIIELDSCLIPESAFECAGDDIIRELKYGDIDGKMYTIKNCTRTWVSRCRVCYRASKFAKYPHD